MYQPRVDAPGLPRQGRLVDRPDPASAVFLISAGACYNARMRIQEKL